MSERYKEGAEDGESHCHIVIKAKERFFCKSLEKETIADGERAKKDSFEGEDSHQGFEGGVFSFGELRFFGH
jgi:hypothetical protein